jgi:hypothetical protein
MNLNLLPLSAFCKTAFLLGLFVLTSRVVKAQVRFDSLTESKGTQLTLYYSPAYQTRAQAIILSFGSIL